VRVLVTGCAGRVGEAVTAHLVDQGFDVRGVDRVEGFDGIDYRQCDLLDAEALKPHIEGVDTVLHLAAIPSPGKAPNADIFQINTAGTFNVFDVCAQVGVGRVVVASSINAVGYFFGAVPFELDYLPADEDHPKLTSDAYSFSKQVTEDIGRYFWQRDGITNTCLRFGAGLRPVQEIRERQVPGFLAARALIEELQTKEPDEQRSELRRMQVAYDNERKERRYERGTGRTPELTPEEHRLMALRHNYFSFVALEDACRGMELSLTSDYEGSHPLLIVDGNNTLMMDAGVLANLVYPEVAVRGGLEGAQSLVSPERARDLVGFETRIHAGELYE
jgi:NAD(P)-dependent dehydrogenase (short-subunit alcohol dehydrogenase family)